MGYGFLQVWNNQAVICVRAVFVFYSKPHVVTSVAGYENIIEIFYSGKLGIPYPGNISSVRDPVI